MKKRFVPILLSLVLVLTMIPSVPAVAGAETDVVGSGSLELDTDPAGGYTGDYVVIYNPSTSSYNGLSTGDMSGLIETEIDPYFSVSGRELAGSGELYKIDVDGLIAEANAQKEPINPPEGTRTSYNVGDVHAFTISNYSPGPSSISFRCIAKGDHCYVWTPSQNLENYYPLDVMDESFAQLVCDEFEANYTLMNSSFGDHSNGSEGDGRVNLMYYNIDDGFIPGVSEGYVAGYFSSWDYSTNGVPMIHLDTYPGVQYENASGEVVYRLSRTYNTFCHEYQHLINYSQTGGMDTWLNESMSAAAEEICYPGSSVVSRIQSWERYYYSDNDDWLIPPHEFEYFPAYELHNGYSMYNWSSSLDYVLPLYSQVSFFSQYLFTHYGNTIFKSIIQAYSSDAVSAIGTATGADVSELVKNFRIALTANDYSAFNGEYGFIPQEGYEPSDYHDVQNPYDLLGPVVFTGNTCSIKGGGAITVKPVGGVYVPPSGAASGLVYIGVTRNIASEPVSLEGMTLTPEALTTYVGHSATIRLARTPVNANDYEVEWSIGDESVASLIGGRYSASVTGVNEGSVTVTCTATDIASGTSFTASALVTVERYPSLDEALNVDRGTLVFTSGSSGYPWDVNLSFSERVCANSGNKNISNSTSSVQTTVQMAAGETLSFDWSVSSESGYDKLIFYVNGNENYDISGNVAFTTRTYTAQYSGTYTFMWAYVKDYSLDSGSDMGYLDNIVYSGDPGLTLVQGDADDDGEVTIGDALTALRCALSLTETTDHMLLACDFNGNGQVDIDDALRILRMALGLI